MPETDQLHPLAVENAELRTRLTQAERERDEARGLLRKWKLADEAREQGLLDYGEYEWLQEDRDAHLRGEGD